MPSIYVYKLYNQKIYRWSHKHTPKIGCIAQSTVVFLVFFYQQNYVNPYMDFLVVLNIKQEALKINPTFFQPIKGATQPRLHGQVSLLFSGTP